MTSSLYQDLASWWPMLSDPADYVEDAALFRDLLRRHVDGECRHILEIGSGGGNTASHMKQWFALTLSDLSEDMLDVSRAMNPECAHVPGDMRTLRLDRTFDGVLIHDAIMYMTSAEDLRRAVETAFVHVRPGGAAVFAPDFVKETFRAGTHCGGGDRGAMGARYLEWTSDPDPADTTFRVDYAFLLRAADGGIRVAHDRHELGVFPRELWRATLADVGFVDIAIREPDPLAPPAPEIVVGRRRK